MPTQEDFSFVAIAVLYLTAPDESTTLRALAASLDLRACRRVVVVDHGPQRQDAAFARLAAALAPVAATYEHAPHNPPLGAAYNAAVRAHLGDASYALMLDQDTRLPPTLPQVAETAARSHAFPALMAPHLRANGRLASPSRLFLGWGRRWSRPRTGWQSLRANTVINSGAWIHRRVFQSLGLWYSESLVLYGTDTDFFRRLGRLEPRFLVLPLEIEHDLSFDAAPVEAKAAKVEAILAANRAIYARDNGVVRAGVRCMNALVRLKYAVQYRSRCFL